MALIGYARVSTEDQTNAGQRAELAAAGCAVLFEETASGGSRARPELARALAALGPGDTLVVVRIDRLARSLVHLLDVIGRLEGLGAHFRSLHDPIDTTTPQGRFALQVLGAAAELERALIRERTRAGLRVARALGRVGGNPDLRRRDPEARRRLAASRDRAHLDALLATLDDWLPRVRALRPERSWAAVARALGRQGSPDRAWTADRLARAVRRLVREGLAEPALLEPPVQRPRPDAAALAVAALATADPSLSLRALAAHLERMQIHTPRGQTRWSASSVRATRARAVTLGLLTAPAQTTPPPPLSAGGRPA